MENYSNTPILHTFLAELLSALFYIKLLGLKKNEIKKCLLLAGVIVVHILYFVFSENIFSLVGRYFMVGSIFIIYLYIWICEKTDWKKRIYYTIRALILAEFMASLEWLINLFLSEHGFRFPNRDAFVLSLTYIAVLLICWFLERRIFMQNEKIHISKISLLSGILIGVGSYMLSGLVLDYATDESSGNYWLALYGIRALIDLAGILMLYAHNMQLYTVQISHDNHAIHQLLSQQTQQYQFSKECIDMVNCKYHDLKHQINLWKKATTGEEQRKYMEELSRKMSLFEQKINSGNAVIDTILTEKMFVCVAKDIQMTVVVEGAEFDHMETEDICAIFGNALDNAIEYEQTIPNTEQRMIHVTSYRKEGFLRILFENYCPATIKLNHEFPRTTKENKRYHGYGLMSINYTVKKYSGEMKISQKDDWFGLNIVLPITD